VRGRGLRGKPVRALVLGGLLALGVLAAIPLAAPAANVAFAPTDDTYSNSGKINGSRAYLLVDNDPLMRGYLRFAVSGLTQPVVRATLRLYPQTSSSSGFDVRSVSSAWNEDTLRASNAPAPASTVTASSGSVNAGTWEALDVTPLVTGNGTFAFALTASGASHHRLATKEGGSATAPQLVVETASSSTTATTGSPPATTSTTPTTTTAPPSGDPVVAVAGDIASDAAGDTATAGLLDSLQPTAVLTSGDNAYPNGSSSDYTSYYGPTWGRFKSVTYPTPGNHEYLTSGAAGYFGYFGSRAGPSGKGFYSYNLGTWHLIALNSEIAHSATSEQVTWLKNDLAASSAKCVLAYWHKPRFTAGNYSDLSSFQPFWDALYAANADVVINGHDHNYQRYAPMTPSGARDSVRGIREFVVGTGGKSHYALRADSRREAADSTSFGVLKLTLRAGSYEWRFIAEAGRTFTDSGSTACH
jgi:hypothetical protein